jgi:maltooligosyltrehalose trehalohydrolase
VRDAAGGRRTVVIAENEPQETDLVRAREQGGFGMDGLWNDDLHHSAVVALTSHNDAYYTDYLGSPQELVSAMKYGYLYQGQWYKWQKNRRGTPALDVAPEAFVNFIENHDQVANSARGLRLHQMTSPGMLKAVTTLILLGPGTPMLFQGQEFASSKPFLYFADPPDDIAEMVRKGRKEFVSQWRSIRMPEMLGSLDDPCSPETFERCKLDPTEREKHASIYRLHCDLIKLRRQDPVFRSWKKGAFDGAVLSSESFLLRGFNSDHGDRLIVINLGRDLELNPAPEPLLAPPRGHVWEVILSTEHPNYGGSGTPPVETGNNWYITGQSAVVMRPVPKSDEEERTSE